VGFIIHYQQFQVVSILDFADQNARFAFDLYTVRKDGKSAGIGLPAKKSGTGTGCWLGTAHQPSARFRCPTFIFRNEEKIALVTHSMRLSLC